MIEDEHIAFVTLHHMGRTGFRPFIVVIGAMDGVSHDEFHGHVRRYAWSGLFVEPVPVQFTRLRANLSALEHSSDNRYENSAIADYDGTIQMLTINQDAIETSKVAWYFGGMSAVYPPRNGLAAAPEVVAAYGELIEVPCVTLATLFARHAVDRIDVLCIDTEGCDYQIIRQFDFSAYRPKLIRCELINLSADERSALVWLLSQHDYLVQIHGQDLDAVAAEYFQEVCLERFRTRPSLPTIFRSDNLTVVTALFDPSAQDREGAPPTASAAYLDHVQRLLGVEWPMVIFAPPGLDELIGRHRGAAKTQIFHRSWDDLEAFPSSAEIQALRTRQSATAAGPGPLTGQAGRRHQALSHSKRLLLHDATVGNPFNTEYFAWIDADIARAIGDPRLQFTDACERQLSALLRDDRMLLVGTRSAPERCAPDRLPMAAWCGEEPEYVVSGQIFAGTRVTVRAVNDVYFDHLWKAVHAGYVASEDQLLTIVSYTHRHLCNLHLVGDGGVCAFLDDLQRVPEFPSGHGRDE